MNTLFCLALAAHMETRQYAGDPDALAAVVAVVQNRVEDDRYPATCQAVIAQPGQFPWYYPGVKPTIDGRADKSAWAFAQAAAKAELDGDGLDITSTHFRRMGSIKQPWEDEFDPDGLYGGHLFFTNSTPWR